MSWLSRRQRDGGVDRIPLPDDVVGELWVCGKHAIGPDHRALIDEVGGTATVVCLTERHELVDRYPDYVAWLDDPSSGSLWIPIHDLDAPSDADMRRLVRDLVSRLRVGETLVVHCGAGMGRAGTTAVCVLIGLGVASDAAREQVRTARPGSGPEVGAQRDLVRRFGPDPST